VVNEHGAATELTPVRSESDQLRHRVLNDYNAVIACIFAESASSDSEEVKSALTRVADCVYELAGALRRDT
jgi:hypothetical protein